MVTRPNWMAPFHIDRGTDTTSRCTLAARASGRRRYHRLATGQGCRTAPTLATAWRRPCGEVEERSAMASSRQAPREPPQTRRTSDPVCIRRPGGPPRPLVELGGDLFDRAHAPPG